MWLNWDPQDVVSSLQIAPAIRKSSKLLPIKRYFLKMLKKNTKKDKTKKIQQKHQKYLIANQTTDFDDITLYFIVKYFYGLI